MTSTIPMGRSVKKTTIDLDLALFRKLKQYALDHDRTIREIVTEALQEKLARETQNSDGAQTSTKDVNNNPLAQRVVQEMERVIPHDVAVRMLSQKCVQHGTFLETLNRRQLSHDLIDDILNSVQYMADERQVAIMRDNLHKLGAEGGA
jgi:predicted transcriptional regulator